MIATKDDLLNWFHKHCLGVSNSRTRAEILPFVQLPDREFRNIASELIHESKLCSHNAKGYWVPIWDREEELQAIKLSYIERRAKALAMLTDVDKQIKQVEEAMQRVTQGQGKLF